MNDEWLEKTIWKKIQSKKKQKSETAAREQNPQAKKRIFVQPLFSHFTLKLE